MSRETRMRALEGTVSPPPAVGGTLDEPCGWCGSQPVRLTVLLRNPQTGGIYPAPVGMVGCGVCHRPSFSEATIAVGAEEGWFEPGGWVYEHYLEHPMTADDIARYERQTQEARAAAEAAGGQR